MLRDLAREGESRVRIRGGCMAPAIAADSEVAVRALRVYWPGDVIVFCTPAGDLAAHRVLGWRPAGLITKGDHCVIHDAPVASNDIIGAVNVRVGIRDRLRAIGTLFAIVGRRLAR
jgi:hypothetical protein